MLGGASPLIIALMLMFAIRTSTVSHDTGWIKYLVQHQDDIIQSLLMSSLMVAVFSTLLRNKAGNFGGWISSQW